MKIMKNLSAGITAVLEGLKDVSQKIKRQSRGLMILFTVLCKGIHN
jgi:hypothetical protein